MLGCFVTHSSFATWATSATKTGGTLPKHFILPTSVCVGDHHGALVDIMQSVLDLQLLDLLVWESAASEQQRLQRLKGFMKSNPERTPFFYKSVYQVCAGAELQQPPTQIRVVHWMSRASLVA